MELNRKNFLKLAGLAPLSAFSIPDIDLSVDHSALTKPEALQTGQTIGLIAPGSPIYASADFDKMISDLQNMGFQLKLGKHVRDQHGYLAGRDEDRAADLTAMFEDDEVDGIICIRGGWGCNRILPLLDFDVIRNHPKVFMGFSDITSLHMAFHKLSNLVTFHGPVGKTNWTPFTQNSFREVVWKGEHERYSIPKNSVGAFTIHSGKAKGRLLGGNLSIIASMIGTKYLPSFSGAILFLEDIGEDVYRIDRMLTQLKLAGILEELSGFIFGKCTDCKAGSNSLSMNQVFEDHIKPLGIPAFYGAMISHEDDNATIPVGVAAEMNADEMNFRLLESGVK